MLSRPEGHRLGGGSFGRPRVGPLAHSGHRVLQTFLDVLEGILGTMMHTLNKGPLSVWLLTRRKEHTEACPSL